MATTSQTQEDAKADEGPPDSKRLKSASDDDEHAALMQELVSPQILSQKETFRQQYASSRPYPHGFLPNVFQDDFLEKVFQEIKANSKVTFKESDLFRVYQSIDFANLNDESPQHQENLPTVLKLRRLLYSDTWRHFIEDLAGLPRSTLSNQVDCACNAHAAGCHLLCHDDVIGSRRVSYIIYLTEPDWQATEGGALELYDRQPVSTNNTTADQRIPDTIPSKTILPLFNHLVFFGVEPGVSFHAVQEVFGDRPRLSLQGWYHADKPPENIQNATLQRLKNGQDKDTEGDFFPIDVNDDQVDNKWLSDQDKEYLSQYLDETYFKPEAIEEIRGLFETESSVQLQNFFQSTWIDKLTTAMANEDIPVAPSSINVIDDPDSHYRRGVSDSWKLVGPAHKQRFLEYHQQPASSTTTNDPTTVGEILALLREAVLEAAPFYRFLSRLTSLGLPTARRGRIRRFRPGLDYTVAHHGLLTDQSVLDATVCFVRNTHDAQQPDNEKPGSQDASTTATETTTDQDAPDTSNHSVWESGDIGGFECYIEADSEEQDDKNQQAADEYNPDDDTELLSVSASMNTLSLVFRDPGTMRFVKYVGSRAPSSRWDIAMEYQVPEDADDGDNNGDEAPVEPEEEKLDEGVSRE